MQVEFFFFFEKHRKTSEAQASCKPPPVKSAIFHAVLLRKTSQTAVKQHHVSVSPLVGMETRLDEVMFGLLAFTF